MSYPDSRESRRALGEKLKDHPDFESILTLIDTLLGEGGCPWDRERSLSDCPKYLAGELQEVIAAIESGDDDNLEEELGDLLFMVAFAAKIGMKEGKMTIDGMFKRILNKMVYRHPHVFAGDMDASTPDEVLSNWQELKRKEKERKAGLEE